eukprot:2560770-Amphidinium_carterae.1
MQQAAVICTSPQATPHPDTLAESERSLPISPTRGTTGRNSSSNTWKDHPHSCVPTTSGASIVFAGFVGIRSCPCLGNLLPHALDVACQLFVQFSSQGFRDLSVLLASA